MVPAHPAEAKCDKNNQPQVNTYRDSNSVEWK